ncbi:arylamine N-acetyltransferase [Pseudomonas sp. R2.Fl]|nr:arylamine N-acetyltransferase [Pseudomonas sp. R2.Fl]
MGHDDHAIYLRRIRLSDGAIEPTVEGLGRLQAAQMRSIAFENIDVFLGQVPDLGEAALWNRLVLGRRGGYCLELNGLFARALAAQGFQAVEILGRVRMGAASGGPRVHHALVVDIAGEEWLADTGFGGPGPVGPVSLSRGGPQVIGGDTFRVRKDGSTGEHVLERLNGDEWFSLYGFDRVPVTAPDFAAANVVCARWELSPFPNHLMMTIATPEGRVSVFDRSVRRVLGGRPESREIGSLSELLTLFVDVFGLDVEPGVAEAVWRRLDMAGARAA